MSIASEWRKKRGDFVGPMSGSAADRITARILRATPNDETDLGSAVGMLVQGVQKQVTFRRRTVVSVWAGDERRPDTFDELPKVTLDAGTRGTTVALMVDGRDLVKLHSGREVLARVGEDCRLLGRWFRFVDRLLGRRFG